MPAKISRRKLANATADKIVRDKSAGAALQQLAGHLIEQRRTKESGLVVRDIEQALLDRGMAIATITSARTLTAEAKDAITEFVTKEYDQVKQVILREVIDERLIGGVKITLPDRELDASVMTKLEKLMV